MIEPSRHSHYWTGASGGADDDLRRVLDLGDVSGAQPGVQWLVTNCGRKLRQVRKAMSVRNDGTIWPELFTGHLDTEAKLIRSLTPAQRKIYKKAQAEHTRLAQRFVAVTAKQRTAEDAAIARK